MERLERRPTRECLVVAGPYAGFSAVGLGNSIRKRRRTVRLALAIALCSDFPQAFGRIFFVL